MVYKVKNWFVFEPGDKILSLKTGKYGDIVNSVFLDIENQVQRVDILFPEGLIESINTNNIDLVRRAEKRPSGKKPD